MDCRVVYVNLFSTKLISPSFISNIAHTYMQGCSKMVQLHLILLFGFILFYGEEEEWEDVFPFTFHSFSSWRTFFF